MLESLRPCVCVWCVRGSEAVLEGKTHGLHSSIRALWFELPVRGIMLQRLGTRARPVLCLLDQFFLINHCPIQSDGSVFRHEIWSCILESMDLYVGTEILSLINYYSVSRILRGGLLWPESFRTSCELIQQDYWKESAQKIDSFTNRTLLLLFGAGDILWIYCALYVQSHCSQ